MRKERERDGVGGREEGEYRIKDKLLIIIIYVPVGARNDD